MLYLSACGGSVTPQSGAGDGTSPSASPTGVSLTVELEGSGSVVSTPTGISCGDVGGSCETLYATGAMVTLEAVPAQGYVFDGWSSDGINCSGTTNCTAAMTGPSTVRATFRRHQHSLTVNISGDGSVTSAPEGISCGGDCMESYDSGTSVTLTAAAAAGYTFSGWSGSGISCSGLGACTVPMTAPRSVSATFSPIATTAYLLEVNRSGSGTVTSTPGGIDCGSDCSQSYGNGTAVTLTATPANGYIFGGWGGACAGVSTCAVAMTGARDVTAGFIANTTQASYLLTWDAVNDTRVTGYRVHYSLVPLGGGSAQIVNVGNVTNYTFTPSSAGIAPGATVYFAVSATADQLESELSASVSAVME